MRKLDRSTTPVPACLQNPPPDRRYKDLRGRETNEIRQALFAVQGERCAYCERRTSDDPRHGGHIEHFREQCDHPHLDQDWHNLFWSCNDEQTCGKHKGNCRAVTGLRAKFKPEMLIDPARENPEDYLVFVSDGTVRSRDDLDQGAQARADETIRVFQLHDSAYLRKSRQDAVRPYLAIVPALAAIGPQAVVGFVQDELQKASAAPFSTAIKHFLESVIR